MITLRSTGTTNAANSTTGLKTAKPQKSSTNASIAQTLINTITNCQLMQNIPPWTIAAAAIKICCGDSPKSLTTNNAYNEKGQSKLFPNQFTTFKNSN